MAWLHQPAQLRYDQLEQTVMKATGRSALMRLLALKQKVISNLAISLSVVCHLLI